MFPIFRGEDSFVIGKLSGKKFLITGAEGNLGNALSYAIKLYVPKATVITPTKTQLNVERYDDFLKFQKLRPDFLLHCAAKVNADYHEENLTSGRRNIVDGTTNAIEFARLVRARFFYPQSFLIFDGSSIPTNENTLPKPLSKYGHFKFESESNVLNLENSLVIRLGGFFGGYERDKNFIGKLHKKFVSLLATGGGVVQVGNRIWQPTYTKDLAENILLLLALEKTGIYNMASKGQSSFYEIASFMTRVLGISEKIRVEQVIQEKKWFTDLALRPSSIVMENYRLNIEDLNRQRLWSDSLREYLHSSYFLKR